MTLSQNVTLLLAGAPANIINMNIQKTPKRSFNVKKEDFVVLDINI